MPLGSEESPWFSAFVTAGADAWHSQKNKPIIKVGPSILIIAWSTKGSWIPKSFPLWASPLGCAVILSPFTKNTREKDYLFWPESLIYYLWPYLSGTKPAAGLIQLSIHRALGNQDTLDNNARMRAAHWGFGAAFPDLWDPPTGSHQWIWMFSTAWGSDCLNHYIWRFMVLQIRPSHPSQGLGTWVRNTSHCFFFFWSLAKLLSGVPRAQD